MAHKRKDTLVAPIEWVKHLRPFSKRLINKAERRASKNEIKNITTKDAITKMQ